MKAPPETESGFPVSKLFVTSSILQSTANAIRNANCSKIVNRTYSDMARTTRNEYVSLEPINTLFCGMWGTNLLSPQQYELSHRVYVLLSTVTCHVSCLLIQMQPSFVDTSETIKRVTFITNNGLLCFDVSEQ